MNISFEPGCYGDGTFGHDHTRAVCADILDDVASKCVARHDVDPTTVHRAYQTVTDLRGDMSDDAEEECNACDILDKLAPIDGHSWGWQDGDFGLWEDSDV